MQHSVEAEDLKFKSRVDYTVCLIKPEKEMSDEYFLFLLFMPVEHNLFTSLFFQDRFSPYNFVSVLELTL